MDRPDDLGILTPDQRLRVFVSSTLTELAAERSAVRDAIASMHLVPVMLEAAARPHGTREIYQSYVEQSHVFVGIYGVRYGRVLPDKMMSRIEVEYDLAVDKPRLLYIMQDVADRDPRLTALLDRFKDQAGVSYANFHDIEDLVRLVKNDLVVLLTEHFLQGTSAAHDRKPVERRVPAPITELIGRDREIREIRKLIDEHRLITITGPGGTGKTRLSIEVVRQLDEPALEGPWIVELAGLQDPDLVASAIAQTLGLVTQAGRATVDALAEVIGDRKALLVLDNCEHLIEAASSVVSQLAVTCPNLKMLATSREPLKVRGEILYPLDPLPITMEVDGEPLDGDAMRMFEARAADVVEGFRLDETNRDAIRKICAALDGLPLAIELAASRLRMLSPQQLWDRLDDRFSVLAHGARDLPDRQRTLLAAIDWSYELLEEPEQEFFKQLSVFRGGFELDAVERVTGVEDLELLDLLGELVAKSLLTVETRRETVRYDQLESLRAYGTRRLDPEEARRLRERHLDWASELAARAEARFRGPEAGRWLDRLDREKDNLRAALAFASDEGRHQTSLELTGNLGWFWYRRGYVGEARHWMEPALASAPDEQSRPRALALLGFAGIEYLDGALAEAARHATDAISVAQGARDVHIEARAMLYAAYFRATLGELDEAEKLATSGRDLAKSAGLRDVEAETYTALGQLARVAGRPDEAESLFLEGADLAREIGHRWHEGSSNWLAAKVAIDRGDAALAVDRLREALRLITSEGDRTSTLVGLHTMAAALAGTGAAEDGALLIGAVAAIGERIGFFPERMDPLDGWMTTERVRTALNADDFQRAYERGRTLGMDRALEIAGVQS